MLFDLESNPILRLYSIQETVNPRPISSNVVFTQNLQIKTNENT